MSETAGRKLATIVALDVAGYSARTEADEAATTAEVAALRPVIEGIGKAHGGRVFNTAGDGFMLEFASSLGAVEAAIELAEKCAPPVRVGVHLGDVVVQPNGDLLGHGVNVAARLMARADPGSTLVSADVKRTIRGTVAERFVSRGLLQLDKMNETIEAFAIGAVIAEIPRARPKVAGPLLAVLAFDNLSSDSEMQFFSEGVAEEILQTISRIPGLNVIGRSSSFQLHGAEKAVANVVRLLKATHVLDGSVRRSGNRLRINAQLVDSASQTTLWSERYDRELADVFLIQDDVARAVANALDMTFKAGATCPRLEATTLDLYLRAQRLIPSSTVEAMSRAALLFEHAVEREPLFAHAWGGLALARAWLSRTDTVAGDLHAAKADAAVERALVLDPNNGPAMSARAHTHPAIGRFIEREAEYEALHRRFASAAMTVFRSSESHTIFLADLGQLKYAIDIGRQVLAVDPLSAVASASLGRMLAVAGRHEEALELLETALERQPDFSYPAIAMVVCAAQCGRWDIVDRLLAPERLAKYPLGRFARAAQVTASILRHPSREAGLQVAATIARSIDRYGWAHFEACALAAHLGAREEVFALVDRLIIAPERARSATVGPDIYQTHAAFTVAYPEIRRDKRFVQLCAKAGLADYWLKTRRWPDCVDEVAPFYDFKAECASVAAARGRPTPA